jgi:hypothetical protein
MGIAGKSHGKLRELAGSGALQRRCDRHLHPDALNLECVQAVDLAAALKLTSRMEEAKASTVSTGAVCSSFSII